MRQVTSPSGKKRYLCFKCHTTSPTPMCDDCGCKSPPRLMVDNTDPASSPEVQARLDKALADIVAEAKRRDADMMLRFPCKTCRYAHQTHCYNPLVNGFFSPQYHIDENYSLRKLSATLNGIPVDKVRSINATRSEQICGPEKALWQQKLSMRQRIIGWFLRLWK